MQIHKDFPRLDLGHTGWEFPAADGFIFGTEQRAKDYASQHSLDTTGLKNTDTRPTLGEVAKLITKSEMEFHGIPEPKEAWGCRTTGPWDEYFSVAVGELGHRESHKWPEGYRWIACYVVTGDSEGLYLHVDAIFGGDKPRREMLFIGKTCSCHREAWEACHASAARIGWLLQA